MRKRVSSRFKRFWFCLCRRKQRGRLLQKRLLHFELSVTNLLPFQHQRKHFRLLTYIYNFIFIFVVGNFSPMVYSLMAVVGERMSYISAWSSDGWLTILLLYTNKDFTFTFFWQAVVVRSFTLFFSVRLIWALLNRLQFGDFGIISKGQQCLKTAALICYLRDCLDGTLLI